MSKKVTSLAEVWIETQKSGSRACKTTVTSLAEVWIETISKVSPGSTSSSLPLRKCGLKRCSESRNGHLFQVTSLAEVWIETPKSENNNLTDFSSLPLRKCGLKHREIQNHHYRNSHFPCGSVD